MPKPIIKIPTTIEPIAGNRKFRLMLSIEVLRQASSGPTAVSRSNKSAMGTITRLKNGGPTVTLCPCTQSERIGNRVPQSTVKQAARSSRLLNRKLDSRDTSDSSLCSLLRWSLFLTKKKTQVASVRDMNQTNHSPIEDCAKACTELITPERVRNVPSIESRNVAKISHMFQTFSM